MNQTAAHNKYGHCFYFAIGNVKAGSVQDANQARSNIKQGSILPKANSIVVESVIGSTPLNPLSQGYSSENRMLAIRMYVEGNSQRAISRILNVSLQTISNWMSAYTSKLPPAPVPEKPHTAELDEMYTFLKQKKKQNLHPNGC